MNEENPGPVDFHDFRDISRSLKQFPLPFQEQYRYCLLRHFGTPENIKHATFLDLGSSIGNQLQNFVAGYGSHIVNIDMDSRVIEELKSTGAEALQGSIYDIPYKTGKADGVICSEVLDIVPKSTNELQRIFSEVHRVLKPNGIFFQRNCGGGLHYELPQAKGQLELLAQTGFHHIRLLERPETQETACFSAVSTPDPQQLPDVLENNFDWVYKRLEWSGWGFGWQEVRNDIEFPLLKKIHANYGYYVETIEPWDVQTIRKNLKEALSNDDPFLLLKTIRSIILQFWPENREKETLLDVAADFDFQFIHRYLECIDEKYCIEKGLDTAKAKSYHKRYGLRAVIDAWKRGEKSEFTFFGRSAHERLLFDPEKKLVTYQGDVQDPEKAVLQIRFNSILGPLFIE